MAEEKTPRARYREEVRTEIKQLAEGQLAELGPAGISLSGIARELGMSGPALYRYFASRDALLLELVTDAYNDLADALDAAIRDVAPPALDAFAFAYRGWALAHPHRYRLLYQPPLPGFDPNTPDLIDAAQRSMTTLLRLLDEAPPAADKPVPPSLVPAFHGWSNLVGVDIPPVLVLTAALIWSRLHGFVSLEISGNFALIAPDARELFAVEVGAILR